MKQQDKSKGSAPSTKKGKGHVQQLTVSLVKVMVASGETLGMISRRRLARRSARLC